MTVSGALTPRWKKDLSVDGYIFLGGVERFDLWAAADYAKPHESFYLRLVWGDTAREWDSVYHRSFDTTHQTFSCYHRERTGPTPDEQRLIWTYITCFVPELARHLSDTLTERTYHEEQD